MIEFILLTVLIIIIEKRNESKKIRQTRMRRRCDSNLVKLNVASKKVLDMKFK